MSSTQETVYRFYNTYLQSRGLRTSNIDTNSATFEFLGDQGFLQSSLTSRWKAYAASIGYTYRGDLDIQNRIPLLNSTILSMFSNFEPGLVYDPSQFDTMFQDSAGTTPVTAAGDPVGLVLDKRLWGGKTLDQAAIPVTASDFASGVDGFAAGASGSVAAVSGELQLTSGAANSYGYKDIATTAGKWYRAKGKLRRISGSGAVFFRAATTAFANLVSHGASLTSSSQVNVSVFYLATTSTSRFYIQQDGTGGNSVFGLDDFVLEEIPGNHASQATSAARPVLARVPFGGRRNILTRTEEFDNAAWTKEHSTSTLPVVTANAGLDPDGNMLADRIDFGVIDNAADASIMYQEFTFAAGDAGDWSGGLYLKAFAAGDVGKKVYVYFLDGVATLEAVTAVTLTNAYQLVTPTTNLGSGASRRLSFGTLGANFAAGAASQDAVSVLAAQAQFEKGTSRSAYQKVTSTHDVTETGKADCWHLSFDGSDDFLVTGSVDFSAGDKLAVFLGAYKASDAANGAIVELSSSPGTSPGRFSIRGPDANAEASYGTFLIGATQSTFYSHTTYTAPITNVLSTMFDIAGANRAQNIAARINAVLNTSGGGNSNSGLGGGNFDNQPIYLGRRGGSSLPFKGKLFGLVIRAGIPNAGQIAAVETYMAGKTGVTL